MSAWEDLLKKQNKNTAIGRLARERMNTSEDVLEVAAELAKLKDDLSMRTLENLKGQSVMRDRDEELAQLRAENAEMRDKKCENCSYWGDPEERGGIRRCYRHSHTPDFITLNDFSCPRWDKRTNYEEDVILAKYPEAKK